MGWLLVTLMIFSDGSALGASKAIGSAEECRQIYAELTYHAAVDGTVEDIRHRCVELHGRDRHNVELSVSKELADEYREARTATKL